MSSLLCGSVLAAAALGGCNSADTAPIKPRVETRAQHARRVGRQTGARKKPARPMPVAEVAPPPQTIAVAQPRKRSLPPVDEDRIAAQGIRKLSGKCLTLYTDLPVDAAIEELPSLFDKAVPEWRDYFTNGRQPDRADDAAPVDSLWRVRGCLMREAARFEAAGLLPPEVPRSAHGYSRGNEIWCREQETAYYRRHLLLHEGTHAYMYARFGDFGPVWYLEAIAELLGTHWLEAGRLKLGYFPTSRDDLPHWGRIKIVGDAVRSGQARSIDEILAYSAEATLQDRAYGWCWAIAAFLDGHPRYRERFRSLPGELRADDFNRQVHSLYADDWDELNTEWQAFIHELDYGYDLVRSAIEFRLAQRLPAAGQTVDIEAARGWQSSGIRLAPNTEYDLTAAGRYQVAQAPTWWCEPGGVTLCYYGGRPLGMLLAMALPEGGEKAAWPAPVAIGLGGTLSVAQASTLYFKINDSPAELADNAGALQVTVRGAAN